MPKNLLFCLLAFRDQFARKCSPATDLFQMFAVLVSDYSVTCSSIENKIKSKFTKNIPRAINWFSRLCTLKENKTHPCEYILEMLMVPLSMVSSCSFSLLETALSAVQDPVGKNGDWGCWDAGFSVSAAGLDEGGRTVLPAAPNGRMLVRSGRGTGTGTRAALFVISCCRTFSLKEAALLMSDSTKCCPLMGRTGGAPLLLSSNFAASSSAGPEPIFVGWVWLIKSSGVLGFLCSQKQRVNKQNTRKHLQKLNIINKINMKFCLSACELSSLKLHAVRWYFNLCFHLYN